jgi:hypothetical protein
MVGSFFCSCSAAISLRKAETTDAELESTAASAGTASFQKLVGEKNRNGPADAVVVELDAVVVVVLDAVVVVVAVVVVDAVVVVVAVVVVLVATGAVVVAVVAVVLVVATGALVVVVVIAVLVCEVELVVVDAASAIFDFGCSVTGAGCDGNTAPTGALRLWPAEDPVLGGATTNGPHALITAALRARLRLLPMARQRLPLCLFERVAPRHRAGRASALTEKLASRAMPRIQSRQHRIARL